jgi:lipoic acid synthetase
MPSTEHAPLRLPAFLRKNRGGFRERGELTSRLRKGALHTVCEEARCPNIGECFSSGTATFMILGDTCTRRCHFCAVKTGRPGAPSDDEPREVAEAARDMGLRHVVITSVDRDDLEDLGAHHWAKTVRAVKLASPYATVEILTPDFKGQAQLLDIVLDARPDVFNHNTESVRRLYKRVRPQSDYDVTRSVLRTVVERGHPCVKSGIMVGLGETDDEVYATLDELRDAGVHIVTIGQYLRPTMKHWPVARYVDEETYARYVAHGMSLGFTHVFAGPFVRSSYHAAEAMNAHVQQAAVESSPKKSLPILL